MTAICLPPPIAAGYWLGRHELLTSDSDFTHDIMYSDINATLPVHSILAVISGFVAILFVIAAFEDVWRLPITGVAVMVIAALILAGAYPALVEQLRIRPNQRNLESPYIRHNIGVALAAYGL